MNEQDYADLDRIPADMLAEVIDTVEDKLIEIRALLDDIGRGDTSPDHGLQLLARQIHNMKGLLGAFGLKALAESLHRLEDHLSAYPHFTGGLLALCNRYAAELQDMHRDELLTDTKALQHLNAMLAEESAALRR